MLPLRSLHEVGSASSVITAVGEIKDVVESVAEEKLGKLQLGYCRHGKEFMTEKIWRWWRRRRRRRG